MEYLRTIADKDIFESPEFEKPDVFKKRTTVKAVVLNNKGRFGFVTNPVHGFCLLAGGGAESGNLEKEIKRECDEEINFEVEVLGEVGRVHEYRNRDAVEYETVCFVVKTIKESGKDMRTEEEKENGLCTVWLDEDEAVNVLEKQAAKVKAGEVGFYNTAFNTIRDDLFFRTYLKNQRR